MLEGDIDMATLTTLLALIDECPSLRGTLASNAAAADPPSDQEIRFISTNQQLRPVQAFLAEL